MPDYLPLLCSFIAHRPEVHFVYDLAAGQVLYVSEAYAHLAGDPGAMRQRAIAGEPAGLRGLLHTLAAEFSPPRPRLALAA